MAFPQQQSNLKTEIFVGGAFGWIDATSDVRLSSAHSGGGINITRGRSAEGAQVDPGSCRLVLNNRHGKWSARNPRSPYYGLLGRNTPIRFSLPDLAVTPYLEYASTGTDRMVTTPDAAVLDIVGDIDVRVDFSLDRLYLVNEEVGLASKYDGSAASRSWTFTIADGKYPTFYWSPDGTLPNRRSIQANAAWTPTTGRVAMRATLTVNNGAAGCTARFYTAPTMAGPFVQLGTDVIQAGTTSIFNSTASLEVGSAELGGSTAAGNVVQAVRGRLYKFELRNGIAGSLVANPDFTAQPIGTTSFTDAVGRVWTVKQPGTRFVDEHYRFSGEVPAWPPRWDLSQNDRWVPMEAAGIFRRLGQGNAPVNSAIYRNLKSRGPVVYMPLEDGTDATIPTSDVGSGATANDMSFGGGDALAGAKLTAKFNSAASYVTAPVVMGNPTEISTVWYVKLPSAPATDTPVMTLAMVGGAASQWVINIASAGYSVNAVTALGTVLASGGWLWGAGNPTTGWVGMRLKLATSGGNVNWELDWFNVGSTATIFNQTGSYVGALGRASQVTLTPAGVAGASISHAAVYGSPFVVDTTYLKTSSGNNAEYAADRMSRLANENGVPFYLVGRIDETVTVGPQRSMTFLELMREAAAADGGILYEARETLGLVYRTRASMYNQTPVSIPFGLISEPFDPTDDDQLVKNDVTVTRPGGGSATATLKTGRMSTQLPPNGVGAYQDSVELNVQTDATLPDQAGWRLHLGTVDELRHPKIGINLAASGWSTNQALTAQAAAADSGDLLQLTALPDWLPSNTTKALAQGYTEFIDAFDWTIVWNGTPGAAWDIATADGLVQRACSTGATLTAGITSSATSLQITSPAGEVWTVDPAMFPLDINLGGEQVTLSGIAGSTSPQTATVTARSVNGVIKAHVAGESVDVWSPGIIGL